MGTLNDVTGALLAGRYRLESLLGEGGQAVVLKVHDTRLEVPRALKVLLPAFARKPKLRARFEAEAQTMAKLDHPNLVRVFDVDTRGAVPYFVMEFVKGGSMADHLARGPVPPGLAVKALIEACEGLTAAHALGVVHRDVKPHNMLITTAGVCKLMDFGIAHLENSQRTRAGAALGTHGYMAPEQANDAATVDARSDVYSVGITAYVLLTGRDPLEWLSGSFTDLPGTLRQVVARATATRKEDRYESAAALADALREALPSLPADPAGATLVLGREGRATEEVDETAHRLEEVTAWFGTLDDETTTQSGPLGAKPPPPAPAATPGAVAPMYTMSRPAARPKEAEAAEAAPAWIAEATELPKGFDVNLDEEEKSLSQEARTRRASIESTPATVSYAPVQPDSAPVVDPVADTTNLALTLLKIVVPVGLAVMLTAVVLAGWQVSRAREADLVVAEADTHLVETVNHELPLVGTLESLGSDPAVLSVMVNDYQNAETPAARAAAGVRLAEHVDAELHRLVEPNSAQWKTVAGPLTRLNQATDSWRKAHASE